MATKRASINIQDDEVDIKELTSFISVPKQVNKEMIAKVSEQSGFVSREPRRRPVRRRSPYIFQTNIKTREGMRELLQDLSLRLSKFDQETFEQAILALIEKEDLPDFKERFITLTQETH